MMKYSSNSSGSNLASCRYMSTAQRAFEIMSGLQLL
jgi:hypothetical protein